MEQQTWVNLLGLSGFGLALMGYLATMKRDLKADIFARLPPAPARPSGQ